MAILKRIWAERRIIVTSVAIILFLAIMQNVRSTEILQLDVDAYNFFVLKLRRPWMTSIMEGFSSLSSPIVIGAMFLMVAAFAPGRRPGLCAAVNLVCVVFINQVLKYIVHRPRPDGFRLISEVGYSFPSGHSMVSMAFYGLCAWMVWHYERDRIMRWACCLAFAGTIVVVGMSRVYLGVHYASDVIAGFCVSLAWIGVYTKVFCPMFMPAEPDQHKEIVQSPVYVEPAHPSAIDNTLAMKARHMRWKNSSKMEDEEGADED